MNHARTSCTAGTAEAARPRSVASASDAPSLALDDKTLTLKRGTTSATLALDE